MPVTPSEAGKMINALMELSCTHNIHDHCKNLLLVIILCAVLSCFILDTDFSCKAVKQWINWEAVRCQCTQSTMLLTLMEGGVNAIKPRSFFFFF